jgi:bleomycin hydrolase
VFKTTCTIVLVLLFAVQLSFAQSPKKDSGKFVEKKNEFYKKILDEAKEKKDNQKLVMDFEGIDIPKSKDDFKTYWHNDPISQGNTGMCWCYCTTSFYESEIFRTTGRKIKLSELYTVYWEYVEKARRYVQKLGDSHFAEGSMGNHIPIIWKKYGIVPADAYSGIDPDKQFHNHTKLFSEMESYLEHVKVNRLWDEETALETIKSILNCYLGKPPEEITVNGKTMTPQEYFTKVIKIDFDDYVDLLSLKEKPYNEYVVFPVVDNWWYSDHYYNVPLDKFMAVLKSALKNGYTAAIGGDTSEPGYWAYKDVAMVPTFDIPSEYIDENARQLRFSNGATTDDHGIHVVGHMEKNGTDWFIIKDSGSSSRNGQEKGYYYYHEDYIKLKMMDFLVHKDTLEGIIEIKK